MVPWHDARGIVFVVQIDGETGAMSSAAVLATPLPRLAPGPDEAGRVVEDRLGDTVVGEPELVWRPCRESTSPWQPFYRVPLAAGEAFVGVDGSVFRHLTSLGRGG